MNEPQDSNALQLCDTWAKRYNRPTPVFDGSQEELEAEKQEGLEHYETMMGCRVAGWPWPWIWSPARWRWWD